MARKKIEKKSGKWKKTLLEEAPVRPPVEDRVLVSGEEEEAMNDAAALLEPLSEILGTYVQKVVQDAVLRFSPPPPDEITPLEKIYTVAQAATLMGLSAFTVREYCRRRVIGVKLGSRTWGITQSEIDRWRRGQILIHGKGQP